MKDAPRSKTYVAAKALFWLSPGTRLGSYEVTALIGQGGMGEVYR